MISTVPGIVDLDACLGSLARDGTLVTLAIPENPLSLSVASLLNNRRSLTGTRRGGIAGTQEMLDFRARHGIGAEAIDAAYARLIVGDVRYRLAIDSGTTAEG